MQQHSWAHTQHHRWARWQAVRQICLRSTDHSAPTIFRWCCVVLVLQDHKVKAEEVNWDLKLPCKILLSTCRGERSALWEGTTMTECTVITWVHLTEGIVLHLAVGRVCMPLSYSECHCMTAYQWGRLVWRRIQRSRRQWEVHCRTSPAGSRDRLWNIQLPSNALRMILIHMPHSLAHSVIL